MVARALNNDNNIILFFLLCHFAFSSHASFHSIITQSLRNEIGFSSTIIEQYFLGLAFNDLCAAAFRCGNTSHIHTLSRVTKQIDTYTC